MRTFKGILILMAAALALLVAVETYKWHHRNRKDWRYEHVLQFDAELGWAPIPNFEGEIGGTFYKTNSHGFRSTEIDPARDQVVLVGDGMAFGYGLSNDEMPAAYLERALDPQKIQVLNLAAGNYAFDQYYLFLKRHWNEIPRPKHVVLLVCTAGEFDETRSNTVFSLKKSFMLFKDGELVNVSEPIHRFGIRRTATWNYLMTYVGRYVPAVQKILVKIAGEKSIPPPEGKKVVKALLTAMRDLAASRGARFHILLSPSIQGWSRNTEDRILLEEILSEMKMPYWDFREELHRRFQRPEQVYLEDEHYNAAGSEALASFIAEKIKSEN
jgi:hypothetical protein